MQLEDTLKTLEQTELLQILKTAPNDRQDRIRASLQSVNWQLLETALDEIHTDADTWFYHDLEPPILSTPKKIVSLSDLKNKPLACVILAGGQGTRFGFSGPKGTYSLGAKTFFQTHIEKLQSFSALIEAPIYIGIMTSESNHKETTEYFEKNSWFGSKSLITLFCQKSLPLLSVEEQIILRKDDSLLLGPDGNGGLFEAMRDSSLLDNWKKAAISSFAVILVDNLKAMPFDRKLLSQHLLNDDEMTWAAIKRKSAFEKVGLFVRFNDKQFVLEYSEVDPKIAESTDSKGNLRFAYANISQFITRLDTAYRLSGDQTSWHAARKTVEGFNVIKLERFIFDHLLNVNKLSLVEVDRSSHFLPIKNATGESSPEEVVNTDFDSLIYCNQWRN